MRWHCDAGVGATSSAGVRSKKLTGLSQNDTVSTGMIGQPPLPKTTVLQGYAGTNSETCAALFG